MDFRGGIVKKKKKSTWIQGTETAHPPTIGVLCHNPPNTSFSNTQFVQQKAQELSVFGQTM